MPGKLVGPVQLQDCCAVMEPQRDRKHILTIDVEDWCQGVGLAEQTCREMEDRLDIGLGRVLDILASTDTKATFFCLGMAAERRPDLLRRITEAGHELATHGYVHRSLHDVTADEFVRDLRCAVQAIRDACGVTVQGYRAPYFSITRKTLWALDVLIDHGFQYDASIAPIHHHRCGIPCTPRYPYRIQRKCGTIIECPVTTARICGRNIPMFGGFYFRFFPYCLIRRCLRRVGRDGPGLFYVHPWELDPDQPRIRLDLLTRIPHYWRLGSTEWKLRCAIRDFALTSVAEGVLTSASLLPAPTITGPGISSANTAAICDGPAGT